jgi:hypothetical protein
MLRLARRSAAAQTQQSLAAVAAGRRWKSALCAPARRREPFSHSTTVGRTRPRQSALALLSCQSVSRWPSYASDAGRLA